MRGRLAVPSPVRTLVVSDLHLGARTGVDVLRQPAALDALLERLDGRGPARPARRHARAAPRAAARGAGGRRAGAAGDRRAAGDAEVVLVAGNHDHRLVAPWLEAGPRAARSGLEERAGPDATPRHRRAGRDARARARRVAYPGLWLADGVYATHGHYLDRHLTVPSFERLAAGAIGRVLRGRRRRPRAPDDYELVLAPLYALLDALAARAPDGRGLRPGQRLDARLARAAGDGRRPLAAARVAPAPSRSASARSTRSASARSAPTSPARSCGAPGLRAMRDVVAPLRIAARHVIFGHTHRAGPLRGDDPAEWALPGGGSLINSGSWVFEDHYLGRGWGGPYWPGGAVELDGDGAPRPVRLLDDVSAARLTRLARSGGAGPGEKHVAWQVDAVADREVEHALRWCGCSTSRYAPGCSTATRAAVRRATSPRPSSTAHTEPAS